MNPKELLVFAEMLINKGIYNGIRILSTESASTMLEAHWIYNNVTKNGNTNNFIYAYGFAIHIFNGIPERDIIFTNTTSKGHSGAAYGLVSGMFWKSDGSMAIAFAINGRKGSSGRGKQTNFPMVEEKIFEALEHYCPMLVDH